MYRYIIMHMIGPGTYISITSHSSNIIMGLACCMNIPLKDISQMAHNVIETIRMVSRANTCTLSVCQ